MNKINSSVNGYVQIDDFSIGWFQGIKLTNLSYADSVGSASVTVAGIQTQPKYLPLLAGRVKLGKTVIDRPQIYLKVPTGQKSHSGEQKVQALPAASSADPETLLPVIPISQVDLVLTHGAATVELAGDRPQTLSLKEITSKVQFDKSSQSGTVEAAMQVDESSSITGKGNIRLHKTGWKIHTGDFDVNVSKLQLASLKPLFALAGLEVEMTGELNANMTAHVGDDAIDMDADAVITDFTQGTGHQRIAFDQPLTIEAKVAGVGRDFYVNSLKVQSQFCKVNCSGTTKSLNYAIDADLAHIQRMIEPFVDMKGVSVAGTLSARGKVGMADERIRVISEGSNIRQLKVLVPDNEPFVQDQVTLDADILVDAANQIIDFQALNLQGKAGESLINITKGMVKKKVSKAQTQLIGDFEAEYDWQILSAFVSSYLPEGLSVKGKRMDAFHFESKYLTEASEQMIAHLNASGAVGFSSAEYFGLNFGPTELQMDIDKGVLHFQIPQTVVNEGQLQFAGVVNLNKEAKILCLEKPMKVLDDVHVNSEMTDTMLKYLNPLFANQGNISGLASLMCHRLEVPFDLNNKNNIIIDAVVEIDKINLEAVGLVGDILAQTGTPSRVDARLLPTQIVLKNGVMQYDKMEFHLDAYPTGFSGKIYLNKRMDMQVFVPYKFDVERLRFPTVKIGDDLSDRLSLPIEGIVDHPEIRLDGLFDSILKKHAPELIQKGIQEVLKNL